MRRLNSSSIFLILLSVLIGMLLIGCIHFLSGLDSSFILLENGSVPMRHIIDHYGYHQNIKGLVFTVTFLISSIFLLMMILLPSDKAYRAPQISPAPQPTHPAPEESSISSLIQKADPDASPQQASPEKEEEKEEKEEKDKKAPKREVVDIDAIEEGDELVEEFDSKVVESEDDVVFGSKQITSAAIRNFVHRFPDSALKFLYRMQLDGKILTREEETIYEEWEKRGMTRGKVKRYVSDLMGWKKLPKRPLYEIWKILRDHIYDNIDLN